MRKALASACALLCALGASACASVSPGAVQSGETVRIAIIGDRTGGHRPQVFETAMDRIDAMQPDLVLSVGDLVEGYVDDPAEIERQWDEIDTLIARFGTHFHAVQGNHDVSSGLTAELWRERRGDPYWSMLHEGVLILGISTEDPPITLPQSAIDGHLRLLAGLQRDAAGTQQAILNASRERGSVEKPGDVAISNEQVEYFARVLADNPTPRWTIVLMHKPAWNYESANFERIEQALGDRDYTMIAGHEHYYMHETRNGRDYVTMGTTGGIWLQDGPGRVDHLLWLTLGEGEPTFANIEIDGIFGVEGR